MPLDRDPVTTYLTASFDTPAEVAELADAQDSGSCGVTPVEVRVLSSATESFR